MRKLIEASQDRQVNVHQAALHDEKVRQMSRMQYDSVLPGLVVGKVPEFDLAYEAVQAFFEALP